MHSCRTLSLRANWSHLCVVAPLDNARDSPFTPTTLLLLLCQLAVEKRDKPRLFCFQFFLLVSVLSNQMVCSFLLRTSQSKALVCSLNLVIRRSRLFPSSLSQTETNYQGLLALLRRFKQTPTKEVRLLLLGESRTIHAKPHMETASQQFRNTSLDNRPKTTEFRSR